MRSAGLWTSLLMVTVAAGGAAPASAAPRIVIPPALQRAAIPCLAEALRLCPGALSSKDYGISCIVPKRRLLSKACRTVYDQGIGLLGGGDLHLDLRPFRSHPPAPTVPRPKLPPLTPAAKPPE